MKPTECVDNAIRRGERPNIQRLMIPRATSRWAGRRFSSFTRLEHSQRILQFLFYFVFWQSRVVSLESMLCLPVAVHLDYVKNVTATRKILGFSPTNLPATENFYFFWAKVQSNIIFSTRVIIQRQGLRDADVADALFYWDLILWD